MQAPSVRNPRQGSHPHSESISGSSCRSVWRFEHHDRAAGAQTAGPGTAVARDRRLPITILTGAQPWSPPPGLRVNDRVTGGVALGNEVVPVRRVVGAISADSRLLLAVGPEVHQAGDGIEVANLCLSAWMVRSMSAIVRCAITASRISSMKMSLRSIRAKIVPGATVRTAARS